MDFSAIEKITLENGLRIMLLPDDSARSACISIWVGSGTRFEQPGTAGVSHFIEHMLFKGTQSRTARDIAEETDRIGGNFNAYTTKEYTCYYARALDSHIPLALDVLCDMLTAPKFSAEDMDTERGVILEEIGMYEDSPEDLLADTLYGSVWRDNMLGANILGTRETVTKMTADDLRAHMAEQYTGSRIVCAVSGHYDRAAVLSKLEATLGALPRGVMPYDADEAGYHPDSVTAERDFEQLHLALCFPAFSIDDKRKYIISIFNMICGGTSSSRLFQRVREELGLAYSVGSSVSACLKEGIFCVDAAINPENDQAALSEIVRVLCRLKSDGVTRDEVERAKDQLKASIIMGLEGYASAAAHMGRSELIRGRVSTEDEIISAVDSITAEQVNDIARQIVDFDKFSLCATGKVRPSNYYSGIVLKSII